MLAKLGRFNGGLEKNRVVGQLNQQPRRQTLAGSNEMGQHMTRLVLHGILAFTLGWCVTSAYADFDAGLAAWLVDDYPKALEELQKTEDIDPRSQWVLSQMYKNGNGVAKDSGLYLKYLRSAADARHAGAEDELGDLYFNGSFGLKVDYKQAFYWYERSAASDYVVGQADLASMYASGLGVTKDEAMALKLFRKAAEKGNTFAQYRLGLIYELGIGVAKSQREACESYRSAGVGGHSQGLVQTGYCYSQGIFGADNKAYNQAFAVDWFRQAADKGNPIGQYELAHAYEFGIGLEKDEKKAVELYRKAANQNDSDAQRRLGICYDYAKGVKKDNYEAVKWYQKSADQGNRFAQTDLGFKLMAGEGVVKDVSAAAASFRKSAEQNYNIGQHMLATMYEDGLGVARDYELAVMWFQKAAELGYAESQNKLGVKLAEGNGAPKNMVEALKWFTISAAAGNEKAVDNRDKAEKVMKPVDVKKAQALAAAWMKKNKAN